MTTVRVSRKYRTAKIRNTIFIAIAVYGFMAIVIKKHYIDPFTKNIQ